MKQAPIIVPEGLQSVLLHACCAPCSSAIVDWLLNHHIQPTIYYFNPNIYPQEEYEIRKQESKRHASSLGIEWIDGDYDHASWRSFVSGLESEPERGRRCEMCFRYRLLATAQIAQKLGFKWFTTTLASSRWKNFEQIINASEWATNQVNNHIPPNQNPIRFWAQNWRKGGLQQRRNDLIQEYNFYNQLFCGCEFSHRN